MTQHEHYINMWRLHKHHKDWYIRTLRIAIHSQKLLVGVSESLKFSRPLSRLLVSWWWLHIHISTDYAQPYNLQFIGGTIIKHWYGALGAWPYCINKIKNCIFLH